jgi:hypothetical protein
LQSLLEYLILVCLLYVTAPSHGFCGVGFAMARAGESTARVAAFDNLGDDSSPDARQTPSPKIAVEKGVVSLPLMPGYFLCCSFALLPLILMTVLQMLPELRL